MWRTRDRWSDDLTSAALQTILKAAGLPDEAALEEIYRIMQEPGIDELFHADEDRFIDRTATVTVPCEVRGGGNAFDPRGTVFDTPDGEPRWD